MLVSLLKSQEQLELIYLIILWYYTMGQMGKIMVPLFCQVPYLMNLMDLEQLIINYPSNGIQNGSPDGMALVYIPTNTVLYFLSYEGVFAATDGPASGMTSVDIGVSETGSEPVGLSLRLTGTGSNYPSFTWQAPAAQSPGLLNQGQTMISNTPPPSGQITYGFTETKTVGSCPNAGTITLYLDGTDACLYTISHSDYNGPTIIPLLFLFSHCRLMRP